MDAAAASARAAATPPLGAPAAAGAGAPPMEAEMAAAAALARAAASAGAGAAAAAAVVEAAAGAAAAAEASWLPRRSAVCFLKLSSCTASSSASTIPASTSNCLRCGASVSAAGAAAAAGAHLQLRDALRLRHLVRVEGEAVARVAAAVLLGLSPLHLQRGRWLGVRWGCMQLPACAHLLREPVVHLLQRLRHRLLAGGERLDHVGRVLVLRRRDERVRGALRAARWRWQRQGR